MKTAKKDTGLCRSYHRRIDNGSAVFLDADLIFENGGRGQHYAPDFLAGEARV